MRIAVATMLWAPVKHVTWVKQSTIGRMESRRKDAKTEMKDSSERLVRTLEMAEDL